MPSILIALGVAVLFLVQGGMVVRDDYKLHRTSSDPIRKHRWLIYTALLLVMVSIVYDTVQERIYFFHVLKANKQHFANVFWLKQYMKAIR